MPLVKWSKKSSSDSQVSHIDIESSRDKLANLKPAMHELSIALSILDIATEESERRGGAQIRAIHIRLGPLSGVIAEALTSAFELAREESRFCDATLETEESPVFVYCPQCESPQPVKSIQMMQCSHCGTPSADVVSGNELEIVAMEIDVVEAASTEPDPSENAS